jgi:molybdate transport system ATP-binding protein
VRYDDGDDLTILSSGAGQLRLAGNVAPLQSLVRLHIRATDVTLAARKPVQLSALNVLEGVIETMAAADASSLTVTLRCQRCLISSRITRFSAKTLKLTPGARAYAIIKAMSLRSQTLSPPATAGHGETDGRSAIPGNG